MTYLQSLPILSIKDLKQRGLLQSDCFIEGPVTWQTTNGIGQRVTSNRIYVTVDEPKGVIKSKTDRGIQTVDLYRVPSNLGKGHRWYFGCRQTGRRCTHLYLYGSLLIHRFGIPGAVYDCQDVPKQFRMIHRDLERQKYLDIALRKGFTPYYNGRPTRTHIRFLKALIGSTRQVPSIKAKTRQTVYLAPDNGKTERV